MLTLWKRKKHVANQGHEDDAQSAKRSRQQNIKVSDDCSATFAAIARAQGYSKAALFEDLVAERQERLERQGVKLEVST